MSSAEQIQSRAEELVARARTAGADAADCYYSESASLQVDVRLGQLEDVSRAEESGAALRVFVGQRSASVSTARLGDADALTALAERAVAMAKAAPDDPDSGMAPAELLCDPSTVPDLQSDDGGDPEPEALRAMALAAEDAARAVPGVTNSEGGAAATRRGLAALVTSHGFSAVRTGSFYQCSASVIAEDDGGKERDYAYRMARYASDLPAPETIGVQAGERAVAKLAPQSFDSGVMPVLFDPRVAGSLVGHLIGAIAGPSITRRTSFLLDKLGSALFADTVTITDDPLRVRGLRSRPHDGEGLAARETKLIDKGVLTDWMLDSASARKLGLQPTGHASRSGAGVSPGATNVTLSAGTVSRKDMIADIKRGVLVTELIGMGVNPVTGDYSRGANGFFIENGEITHPVNEITIASNLIDMFASLVPASDLEMHRAVNTPTLRVDGMTVARG